MNKNSNDLLSLGFFYWFSAEIRDKPHLIQKFMDEAKTMTTFNHPNVMSLTGISKIDGKYSTITDLMENGELKKYLMKHRDDKVIWSIK